MPSAAAAVYVKQRADEGDGDTTETDSDSERNARCKREIKREARAAAAAIGAAVYPPALPLGISPNSILAVAHGPPVEEEYGTLSEAMAVSTTPMEPLALPVPSLDEYCETCMQKFKWVKRHDEVDGHRCACCLRAGLPLQSFNKNQLLKGEGEQRCKTCSQGDSDLTILNMIRTHDLVKRQQLIAENREKIARKRNAIEKRRATMAQKKRECELQLEQEEQEEREEQAPPPETITVDDESSGAENDNAVTKRMQKAVRDILTANRSIHRRRQVVDLDGPDREAYLRQLIDEETRLHEQAAALCLENPAIYDRVCEKLLVVDGKVKLGERDHEQGDFDGDKPNHGVTKSGKTKIIRQKPDPNAVLESNEALLRAAKATAERRRETMPVDEPARKRVKRVNADGIEMAVLNRPRRRVAKPATYVIDSE